MLRVLIVDDEPLVRQLLKKIITWEEHGLTISGEASDVDDAMKIIRTEQPDVVFTDIMMPGTNGLEFTKMIGEFNPAIRVVLVSGYDEFEYANQGIKLGVFDYILKPIDRDVLAKIADSLREDIAKERSREEEFAKIKDELNNNASYIIEKAFCTLQPFLRTDNQNIKKGKCTKAQSI